MVDAITNGQDSVDALTLIEHINMNITEAQDNLLVAKLSTAHHQHEYVQAKSGRVTKFMPCCDGPFTITKANLSKSTYTLGLPNELNRFPPFHSSLLRHFVPNDNDLFPSWKLTQPEPVLTLDSEQEWLIDCILDKWIQGCGWQFLMHWQGWGMEEDRWLPGRQVAATEALDIWLNG
jgi:hypothetical protein